MQCGHGLLILISLNHAVVCKMLPGIVDGWMDNEGFRRLITSVTRCLCGRSCATVAPADRLVCGSCGKWMNCVEVRGQACRFSFLNEYNSLFTH